MNSKTISTILLVLVLVVAGYFLFFAGFGAGVQEAEEGEGRLFISFTDAAADMEAVSEVHARIDEVQVHSEAQGWVRVSSDDTEYELLALRDSATAEFYGQVVIPEGEYNKVRVVFDDVTVEKTDGSEHKAVLVTSTVDVDATTRIESQKDSHVTVDILADKSLHTAVDGSYVFAPALTVETRSNTEVAVDSETNVVTLTGGTVDALVTIGTDVDGSVKANFEIPDSVQLDVSLLGGVSGSVNGNASSSDSGTNAGVNSQTSGSGSVNTGSGGVDVGAGVETNTDINIR